MISRLFRPRKYVDIKEAPLIINNTLKEETKRKIIRSLRHEKKYLSAIARDVGEHVAKIKYHLVELERLKIVTTMRLTREKFFILTDLGKWCVKAIDVYYPERFYQTITGKFQKHTLKPPVMKNHGNE